MEPAESVVVTTTTNGVDVAPVPPVGAAAGRRALMLDSSAENCSDQSSGMTDTNQPGRLVASKAS